MTPLKCFTVHLTGVVCALTVAALPQSAQTSESKTAEAAYQQSLDLSKNANHAQARAKLFEAVNLWVKGRRIDQASEALLQSANRHKSEGRWQYAIECYRRVLELNALSPQLKTSALISLAELYLDLRQFDLALAGYRQSLRLAEGLGDRDAQAQSLTGLASVYAEQGETAQSLSLLGRARVKGGTRKTEADALCLIGHIYYGQERYHEAREALEQALETYRKIGERNGESLMLCSLSNVLLAMGRKEDALERAKEALSSVTKGGEHAWRGWIALARAQRALAQRQEALKSFYRAFAVIEKQGAQVSVDSLKIGFMEERQAAYKEMADLLIEIGRGDEALSIIEYARSRSTLELLAGTKQRDLGPERKKVLQEISQKVASLNIELGSSGIDDHRRAALKGEIEQYEQREHSLRIDAQMEGLKRFVRPHSLKELQKEVLRPGETLLEFALTEHLSHVWLVTAEKVLISSLPGRREIDQEVRQYLQVLSAKPSNLYLNRDMARQKYKAKEIFDRLLGGFKDQLPRGGRLIVVPDGPLYDLPFEALVCDDRYLIEDHVISYMPSASVLGVLRRRAARESAYPMELLAFGDPVGSSKAGDLWVSGGNRMPPLPNTRGEVLAISQMFPPLRSRIYLGRAMKEEAIKNEDLRLYRRLHFATHSLVDDRLPSRSAIVFAAGGDSLEDGFLTIDEISDLELDCEVVVLSACQTGRGQVLRGEGVVGLARSFLFAGARSVIVSLWNVSDLSSSEFMQSLYRHFASNSGEAESLRQAKLELMAKGKALEHPYYWAPFVFVGP